MVVLGILINLTNMEKLIKYLKIIFSYVEESDEDFWRWQEW